MPDTTAFPLLRYLLRPLIILLLILALVSVVGSSLLLHDSLITSVDLQLDHAQKMIYKDLKQREILLADLLYLLAQKPASVPTASLEKDAQTYQPQLEIHLYDTSNDLSPPLQKIADFAREKQTALRHIIYDQQMDSYSLVLLQPASAPRELLLLQLVINKKLLNTLSDRYLCELALYSEEGHLMVNSSNLSKPEKNLSDGLLTRIASNNNYFSSKIENINFRSLYAPLPLGSNAILYLSASKSLGDLNSLIATHGWRLLLSVFMALAVGVTIYYRILLRTLIPLKNLLATIHQISRGNLSCRTEIAKGSQLHELGRSFNQMLGELETLYENRLEAARASVLDLETHKYNQSLKKKTLQIEKVNIQLKEQYEELSALFLVSRSLTTALDQNVLFEKVFTILRDTLHCDRIVLLIYHPGSESLEVIKTTGIDTGTSKGLSFKVGEGISGMAAASMQPIYCPDLSTDDRNLNYKGRWVSTGSLLSMPMVLQNRLIGILNIHHHQNEAFNPMAQQMAQAIADQTAISIENSRLYEKTRMLSATDDLTGLANRRQFQDILQRERAQSRRYHHYFSVLMLDIDKFKAYNDTHGHLKGDIVLKKVSALLLQNTRGIDLVARFGGEEFVILLPKADKEGSLAVAKKLCSCIASEYFTGMEASQPDKKLTISIGASTFPTDGTDIYDLLNRADEALYQVKRNGRNDALSWTKEMSLAKTPSETE